MEPLFSTDRADPKHRFRLWRDICEDRLVPMVQSRLNDEPFHAVIEGASVGTLQFTRVALSNLKASTTPATIRHKGNKSENLFVSIILSGTVKSEQNERLATDMKGDISIRDPSSPWSIEHKGHTEVLAIGLPRERLERLLGSARHYAALIMYGKFPTTTLARSFLFNLLSVGRELAPDAAERIATIGIDLIVASVAERIAQETSRPLQNTVTVQKAKAYIDAHLSDTTLDPPQIAAAVGVSLRHLQQLFHERGRHISDHIWQRRLQMAAQQLADPGLLHLSLGTLSYGCGFVNQAHFSRRFKGEYDLSPGDYRRWAIGQKNLSGQQQAGYDTR